MNEYIEIKHISEKKGKGAYMRQKALGIMMVVVLLTTVCLAACGGDNGGNGDTTTTTTTTAATTAVQTTESTTAQPSNGGGDGLTWNDMPIYPGADQIQEFSMSFSPEDEAYSEFEWRYYECGADVEDVVDFYKDKMPDNGWDEQMWADMGEIAYGMYMKNNEKDAAMVWISSEGGDTMIALWRASE